MYYITFLRHNLLRMREDIFILRNEYSFLRSVSNEMGEHGSGEFAAHFYFGKKDNKMFDKKSIKYLYKIWLNSKIIIFLNRSIFFRIYLKL
ncbi:hypothetical protein BpHYR1_024637 [Brachionus plicatilis]|uniref:Uncharacterized protein n=1 Tax=Brachionus plicatilis TaxID=10195 RepID=A0A3M7SGI5_BRAPC|nr:hypothetical protein BpHYR1_024637 [Brachionus plicatilis]